jgi:hypothetical protein
VTGTDFERALDAEAKGDVEPRDEPSVAADDPVPADHEATIEDAPTAQARTAVRPTIAESVAADLRVARVLLRSGNALPARVQLETLVGRRQLDLAGMLDLAESRWRTGDLDAAGEAVTAYLEAGGSQSLGFLIAAEATAAAGRPGEARKLARRALQDLDRPLDTIFAGQPRSSIWPHDPAEPVQPAGTLFAAAGIDAAHGGRIGLTAPSSVTETPYATDRPVSTADRALTNLGATPSGAAASGWVADGDAQPEYGLWDQPRSTSAAWSGDQPDGPGVPDGTRPRQGGPARPDVGPELDAARAALAAGDTRGAAMQLSIVLRRSPGLAPAVLDLVGQLPGVDLDLLRGDALRLVGREAAAERAYAAAADALRGQAADPTQPTEHDPTRSPE